MLLSSVGILLLAVALGCFLPVLRHAFGRSLGTGFMVLCVPVYTPYYAFSQFEHHFKGPLVAGYLGGFVLGVMLHHAGGA